MGFPLEYVLSCVRCRGMGIFVVLGFCLTVGGGMCLATAVSVAINRGTPSVLVHFFLWIL